MIYGFKEDFGRIKVRGDIKLLSGVPWTETAISSTFH